VNHETTIEKLEKWRVNFTADPRVTDTCLVS